MSTSYYVETIERITEQMLVEEVIAETESIKTDAIRQTDRIKDSAINYIEKQRQDTAQISLRHIFWGTSAEIRGQQVLRPDIRAGFTVRTTAPLYIQTARAIYLKARARMFPMRRTPFSQL